MTKRKSDEGENVIVAIRQSNQHLVHVATQPGHQGPYGPVATQTLCNRRIHHGPDSTIQGPLTYHEWYRLKDCCRRCEALLAKMEAMHRYGDSMRKGKRT